MAPTFHFEHHTYSGFEPSQAFDIVYGGHFEHRLLSPKRATMEHRRLMLRDIRLEAGCYDFPVIAQGVMPQDSVCIGMVADGIAVTRFNTEFVSGNDVQVYAPGAELMYHATGASGWISFTVVRDALQRTAQERLGRPLSLPARGIETFQLHPAKRAFLQRLADDAFALAAALQPGGFVAALADEVSDAFIAAYVDALGTAELAARASKGDAAWRHYHLILACERLVLTQGAIHVDVAELARRSGYSRRSLELIFQRGVGMTPSRWFTNIRLNGALRELLSAGPDSSVTDVAMRWGFRHLSRFAEQYQMAFGELPSQTLGSRVRPRLH